MTDNCDMKKPIVYPSEMKKSCFMHDSETILFFLNELQILRKL